MNSTAPVNRRKLMFGAALSAGGAGAGLAWWRSQNQVAQQPSVPNPGDAQALTDFWSLKLSTPEGKEVALLSFRGQPLLINFWATWCPPCVEELPLIDSFFQQNRLNGWQVLGLAVDQPTAVKAFLDKMPLSFPIALAGLAGIELSRSFGNISGGLPFSVVLNASGNVVQRKIGQVSSANLADWSSPR